MSLNDTSQRETSEALIFILETLKHQLEYSVLLHNWVVAVNETLQVELPELAAKVGQHPLYKGQPLTGQTTGLRLVNIDVLIQRLKGES